MTSLQSQAIVVREPGRVAVERVSVPAPTPHDVVVRVTHSWISPGTEGSFIRGERLDGETARRPTDPLPFPLVPGYQKVGVAEWVGDAVSHVAVGETVFAAMSRVDDVLFAAGGHVSPAVTPADGVWSLPQDSSPLAFSGLVLTQVGYNCAMRPTLAPGDAAVVIGDGLVGHWSAQALRLRGARVLLVGRHEARLSRLAPEQGIDRLNSRSTELAAAVGSWAPEGIQAVIDTVGSVETIVQLLPHMRRQGHLVSAGFLGAHGAIDIQQLRPRELTLHAPSGWTRSRMDATRDHITSGALLTEPLITHRFPLAAAADAFAVALNDRTALGVIIDWE